MFFHFSQNNSGGSFDFDEKTGITHHVVIEADDYDHANYRAERIGLYFGGGMDCPCCGDRWSSQWSGEKGNEEPKVYDKPVAEYDIQRYSTRWMDPGKEIAVHYCDGRVEWF
jgi:hypothetical protein